MSRLEKRLILIVAICCVLLITLNIYQRVEIRHLNLENAKFKQEIECLNSSNELLQEDNVKFQDALWHYHDKQMKVGAE